MGRRRRSAVVRCPVGESASGLASLADTGRSRAGGGVARSPGPSPAQRLSRGRSDGKGRTPDPPWKVPDRTDSRPCGLPRGPARGMAWLRLGEPRARQQRTELASSPPAGRPPREARGTAEPPRKEKSPVDSADRPRPESAAAKWPQGHDQSVGARTTVKPVELVHISTPIHRLFHNPP